MTRDIMGMVAAIDDATDGSLDFELWIELTRHLLLGSENPDDLIRRVREHATALGIYANIERRRAAEEAAA